MSNPTSPVQTRDIRSAAKSFKRDRDSASKWAYGARPHHGHKISSLESTASSDILTPKVRPGAQPSNHWTKASSNKATKPNPTLVFHVNSANLRVARKADAVNTAHESITSPLSRSLLELLPQYASNTEPTVQSMSAESSVMASIRGDPTSPDAGVLYSFDNTKSPGKEVALGGLVDQAEQKWMAKETDRLVRMEYAVLDNEGEVVGRKGGKAGGVKKTLDEDDDFEIVDRYE